MKKFSTVVRSAAVASVMALGMSLGAVAADAQPQLPSLPIPGFGQQAEKGAKQIVTFGDSFTANAGKGGPVACSRARPRWWPTVPLTWRTGPRLLLAS